MKVPAVPNQDAAPSESLPQLSAAGIKQQENGLSRDDEETKGFQSLRKLRPLSSDQLTQPAGISGLLQGGDPRLLRRMGHRPGRAGTGHAGKEFRVGAEAITKTQSCHAVKLRKRPEDQEPASVQFRQERMARRVLQKVQEAFVQDEPGP